MSGHIYIYCFACREQKAHSVIETEGMTVLRCASCNATAHSQSQTDAGVAKPQQDSTGITWTYEGSDVGVQRPTSRL